MTTSDLSKYTTCDLLKSFNDIGQHLIKVVPDKTNEIIMKIEGGKDMVKNLKKEADAEAKYDPTQTEPETSVEEKNKPAETAVSQDADAKMGKGDCQCGGQPQAKAAPPGLGDAGAGGEPQTSPSTDADVLQQILAAISEIKALLASPGAGAPAPAPAGGNVQMSDTPAEVGKTDIGAEVKKALDAKFHELGIVSTKKPGESPEHPIVKSDTLSMDKIAKMSWMELNAIMER